MILKWLKMGMSNKQFTELLILLMLVAIVWRASDYLNKAYGVYIGLVSWVVPYTLIILYLAFTKLRVKRGVKKWEKTISSKDYQ